jgi:hypothetical protein
MDNAGVRPEPEIELRRAPRWVTYPQAALGYCLVAIGALAAIGNVLLIGHRILGEHEIAWAHVPWSFRIWEIELRLASATVGIGLIVAGLWFTRGHWKGGIFISLLAVLLAMVNVPLNHSLRNTFAGDGYTILPRPTGSENQTRIP